MLYITFDAQRYLRVELAYVRAEQRPFPCTDKQGYPVGQVGFQFQRQRTAVDEAILIQQGRAVRQQLFASVACFVPGESRQAQ